MKNSEIKRISRNQFEAGIKNKIEDAKLVIGYVNSRIFSVDEEISKLTGYKEHLIDWVEEIETEITHLEELKWEQTEEEEETSLEKD